MSDGPDRRKFLKVTTCALGGGLGLAVGIPALRVIADPASKTTVTGPTEAFDVGSIDRYKVGADPRKVELGRRLYLDPRLSGDGRVTCASCHAFEHGGAIAQARSDLPGRPPVAVNVPSLLNASFNFRFAWNGRFTDIGRQLDVAMNTPAAMASSWGDAAGRLSRDPQLTAAFQDVYAGGLSA